MTRWLGALALLATLMPVNMPAAAQQRAGGPLLYGQACTYAADRSGKAAVAAEALYDTLTIE